MQIRMFILPLLILGFLAACQPGGEDTSSSKSVEERAQERWDHIIAGEYAEAWEYYSPGFRQLNSLEDFIIEMKTRPIVWNTASVTDKKCEENQCVVSILGVYEVVSGPSEFRDMSLERTLEESWLRTDGQWWYTKN